MCTQLARGAVVRRLEGLLPGLSESALRKASSARAKLTELWSRRHPGEAAPGEPWSADAAALDVDAIIEHATAVGALVERSPIEDGARAESPVLAELGALEEELFVVLDDQRCVRVLAAELRALLRSERAADGDLVVLGSKTARVVVVHHEQWLFDIRVTDVRCAID